MQCFCASSYNKIMSIMDCDYSIASDVQLIYVLQTKDAFFFAIDVIRWCQDNGHIICRNWMKVCNM